MILFTLLPFLSGSRGGLLLLALRNCGGYMSRFKSSLQADKASGDYTTMCSVAGSNTLDALDRRMTPLHKHLQAAPYRPFVSSHEHLTRS